MATYPNSRLPGTTQRPSPPQRPPSAQNQRMNPSPQPQPPASSSTSPSPAPSASAQSSKPSDYVYFDRTTSGFSAEAVPKAKGAQVKLEHFYKVAVEAAIERNTRYADVLSKDGIVLLME